MLVEQLNSIHQAIEAIEEQRVTTLGEQVSRHPKAKRGPFLLGWTSLS